MIGQVLHVSDFGSFVTMHVSTDDRRIVVIPFDHRAFNGLLTGEKCEPEDLHGRRISFDSDRLQFADDDF